MSFADLFRVSVNAQWRDQNCFPDRCRYHYSKLDELIESSRIGRFLARGTYKYVVDIATSLISSRLDELVSRKFLNNMRCDASLILLGVIDLRRRHVQNMNDSRRRHVDSPYRTPKVDDKLMQHSRK